MNKLKVLDLFSGIGGFSLGLERTRGFETVAFCEIEESPRRILEKHWPKVHCYHDVRELNADTLARDGIAVDVICGGFPCQDTSIAGRGAGIGGIKSGLWGEYRRLIGKVRPAYVIVENSAELLGRGLGDILGDLAKIGFDAEWHCIPAAYVGAPHDRDRIWIVAYPDSQRRPVFSPHEIRAGREALEYGYRWQAAPSLPRVDDGISRSVDRNGTLGNAVVPQIPELIGRAILESIEREAVSKADRSAA